MERKPRSMIPPEGEDAASFGQILREYRLDMGLTQEALAERAGLNARTIQHLERGTTRPYRDMAQRLVHGHAAVRLPVGDSHLIAERCYLAEDRQMQAARSGRLAHAVTAQPSAEPTH